MLTSFFSRQLAIPDDRIRPAIRLLGLAVTTSAALVISVVAAQSLFLTHVGADRLPVFYLLLAFCSLPVSAAVSSLLDRTSNLGLLARVILLAAVASLGLWLLILAAPELAYYAALLVYCLVVMQVLALFSALLTDYFTALELKRFVVFLTMANALGGLVGGISLGWISRFLSTSDILLGLVGFYGLIAWQLLSLARSGKALAVGEAEPKEGVFANVGSLTRLARRYPMTVLLAAGAVLTTVIHSIFEVQVFAIFAREFPSEKELTAFLGMLNAGLKALEIAVAYILTRPLIRRLGVGPANLAYPLTCLAAFIGLAIAPALPAALGAVANYRMLSRSVAGPVNTLNYNAVPQRWVGRVRVLVNGLMAPIGLALSGVLLLVAQARLSTGAITGLGALLSVLFVLLGFWTTRAYFRSLLEMIRARTVNLDEVTEGLVRLPSSQAEAVREMLRSDEPQQCRGALELLERMDVSLFEAELQQLLQADDRTTVRATVELYRRTEADYFDRRGPRLLDSGRESVRAAALETLMTAPLSALPADSRRRHAGERVRDSSPEVRAMALAASYQLAPSLESLAAIVAEEETGTHSGILRAPTIDGRNPRMLLIDELLGSAAPEVRRRILVMLGEMAAPGDDDLLELARARVADDDPRVRHAAIRLLATTCTADQLTELAHGLDDAERVVRDAAARALVERGRDGSADAAITATKPYLASPRSGVAGAAVSAIGGIGTPAAEEVLFADLRDDLEQAGVVRGWLREIPAGEVFEPLRVAVDDAAERIRRRVFRALAALGEESTLKRVRQLMRAPDQRLRANAIETFGSIGRRRLTQPVLELLEAQLVRDATAEPGLDDADPGALLARACDDRDLWIRRAARFVAEHGGIALSEPESLPAETPFATLRIARDFPEQLEREVSMNRLLFLNKVPLFSQFTLDELSVIDAALEQEELLAQETLFAEGQPGDSFFIVLEGQVLMHKRSGEEDLEMGRMGPGEYFGEMALFDTSPRSATAVAAEDTLLLALDRERLRSLIDQKPEVAWAFCRELSVRLREANERLRNMDGRLKDTR